MQDYLKLYGLSLYIMSILQNAPNNGGTMSVETVWPTTDLLKQSRIGELSKELSRRQNTYFSTTKFKKLLLTLKSRELGQKVQATSYGSIDFQWPTMY